MIICQHCGCKSQLPLCNSDAQKLRDMLIALAGHETDGKQYAGWLENLADAATGHTRMGNDNGRRGGSDEAPIRVNFKASDLMVSVRGTLARIVQELCEDRGLTYVPVRFTRPNFIGPLPIGTLRGLQYTGGGADLALWLLEHSDAVAVSVDAGMCFEEIETVINAIKIAIDRPPDMRTCGECPTMVGDNKKCGNFLRADKDEDVVKCAECNAEHSVDRVIELSLARADHMPWTADAIMRIVDDYGLRLNARTWRDWRQNGVVKPCLYQRPNGRIGIDRQNNEDAPLYRLSDVREAIAAKGKPDRREAKRKVAAR